MKVEIYRDAAGEWRWRLVARNHRIVADSGEGYASKRNAKRAWKKCETTISSAWSSRVAFPVVES